MPNRANGVPTTAHFEVLGIEIGGCASALARTVRRCDVTVIAPRYDIPWYGQRMKVDKISISFEAELGDEVRAATSKAGMLVSSWLAEAAAGKLRAEALADFLDTWERKHGPLTVSELSRAESELGLRPRKRSN